MSNTLATSHMWLADIYFVANQRFVQPHLQTIAKSAESVTKYKYNYWSKIVLEYFLITFC